MDEAPSGVLPPGTGGPTRCPPGQPRFPGAHAGQFPWGLARWSPTWVSADITWTRQSDWCPKNCAGALMSTERPPPLLHKPPLWI